MANNKFRMFDVAIIGGGIAAHSAAIYTARDGLSTLVIAAPEIDQLSYTTLVENFPGFPDGVLGSELVANARKQAEKFGAEYAMGRVNVLSKKKDVFELKTDEGAYTSRSIIIATGAAARTLNVPGKDKYFGRGIAVCAVCDAPLYRGKDVVLVGGGDSAMEESLSLAKFARKVVIVHRRDKFRASKIMQRRVFAQKRISVMWDSELKEVLGDGKFVTGAKIKNAKTGKEESLNVSGVFFAIGHTPNTEIFKKILKLDKNGFIKTDRSLKTSMAGVFAAGDCQDHAYRQAITSAGSGAQAALEAEAYVEEMKARA